MECRPLAVAGVPADLLCYTPDTTASLVNVSAMVNAHDSTVPYVVVREALMANPRGFDRLEELWGSPDTTVGTARRWRRGTWTASADTAIDILTVWLTDSLVDRQVAFAARDELLRKSGRDTMPVVNDEAAVLDSLLNDSTGGRRPLALDGLEAPPSVVSCNRVPPPAHLAGRPGAVTLAYIVDTLGQVEPANVRVLHASHGGLVPPAVATVQSCRLDPGRQGGRPVRTVVSQRISFTAESATPKR